MKTVGAVLFETLGDWMKCVPVVYQAAVVDRELTHESKAFLPTVEAAHNFASIKVAYTIECLTNLMTRDNPWRCKPDAIAILDQLTKLVALYQYCRERKLVIVKFDHAVEDNNTEVWGMTWAALIQKLLRGNGELCDLATCEKHCTSTLANVSKTVDGEDSQPKDPSQKKP